MAEGESFVALRRRDAPEHASCFFVVAVGFKSQLAGILDSTFHHLASPGSFPFTQSLSKRRSIIFGRSTSSISSCRASLTPRQARSTKKHPTSRRVDPRLRKTATTLSRPLTTFRIPVQTPVSPMKPHTFLWFEFAVFVRSRFMLSCQPSGFIKDLQEARRTVHAVGIKRSGHEKFTLHRQVVLMAHSFSPKATGGATVAAPSVGYASLCGNAF